VWDDDPDVMARLAEGAHAYADQFGFGFVMFVGGLAAADVLTALTDRLHNDAETERKVVRNELAKINRTRLERMLGPEGGFHNW
jgi:2-oxo-4-hydroxy-4-carboxy--5-ureidoimidazoline (OHCU) decarboxylase